MQERNYASSSELVPTGMPYGDINNRDYISIHQKRILFHVHPYMVRTHRRLYCVAENEFVSNNENGILYNYQSTEPYDRRNCQIMLPPIQDEKVGIQETTRTQWTIYGKYKLFAILSNLKLQRK